MLHETDFLVIGAGIAGLRAAIELAAAGRVLVLAKGELERMILSGELAPGAKLTEMTLAARLGVIRPPVERALAKLTAVPIDIEPRFTTAEQLNLQLGIRN